MIWRFKRTDFIDDKPEELQRACKRVYAAVYGQGLEIRKPVGRVLDALTRVNTLPGSQSLDRRLWLHQIPEAQPVSQRMHVCRDGHSVTFRHAGGQPHFWRQLNGTVMTGQLYWRLKDLSTITGLHIVRIGQFIVRGSV